MRKMENQSESRYFYKRNNIEFIAMLSRLLFNVSNLEGLGYGIFREFSGLLGISCTLVEVLKIQLGCNVEE